MALVASRMIAAFIVSLLFQANLNDSRSEIRVLMLGDSNHHRPELLANVLREPLHKWNITLDYTEDVAALNAENLKKYNSLLFYLNTELLPAQNEAALVEYLQKGGGLAVLHCASACFSNSERYTKIVGGRFVSHGASSFRAKVMNTGHPVTRGFEGFESFDETYVHNRIADDIQILMTRAHAGGLEPWTWVRSEGKGRVFYTASGHDEKTWNIKNYQNLIARALLWTSGELNDSAPAIVRKTVTLPPNIRTGGEILTIPEPLSPADSMQHMRLPEGFDVELFASEPDIVKPISMAFDARGRLWVIESLDYPNTVRPEGERGNDRIKICEDTDRDGKADKFTIFADGLNLPQSLTFTGDGIAIVAMAPNIWWMEDSNNDGVCDVKKILYSGFHRGDTHAMHGNFQNHPDGYIYATCGYSGFSVTTRGQTINSAQCIFRFATSIDMLEVVTSTSNNTWGLGINEYGEIFASTANNSHAIYCAIPNRYIESVLGFHASGSAEIEDHKRAFPVTNDIRQVDWNGGFTAASGFTIYTGHAFPAEFRNRAAFVCEPTMHLIHTDLLEPRGSGYVAHDGFNMMASSDPWCAPIQTVVGPDGALWFIDWYNYVVQHNPTPEYYKTGAGNAYETPLRDRKHGRIYRIFNTKNPSRLPEKFGYFPSRMRRGEVNSKPRVLAILLAKSEEPASEKEGAQIFEMIHVEENINDPWIPTAAIIAGARHFSGFLTSALAHQIPAPDAHAEKIRRIVTSVAGHAAREDAGLLLSMLIDSAAEKPSPYFMTIAEAWTQAAEANSTIRIQQKDINHLQSIFPRIEGESKAALVLLLRKAKVTLPAVDAAANEIVSNLRKIAIDPSRGDEARILAFRRIVDLDESAAAFEEAISQIKPPSSPELANAILELVSKSRAPETADALFQHWLSFTPSTRRSAIGVLLRRAAWTESLLSMMEAGTVSRDDFSVEQIQQLSSYPDSQGANANIRTRAAAVLAKKGGVPDADREAIVKKWLPVILKKGDVALGKLTFQKNCMVCHAYSGEGGKAAPDLAGIHNGNREEILISILDPNRSVEANFKPWAVWKSNGELVSGLLASETQTGFELMDAQGKRSVVLRNEVKDIQMQTISFMPAGFESLKEEELAGLIEMLAQPKASLPRDK